MTDRIMDLLAATIYLVAAVWSVYVALGADEFLVIFLYGNAGTLLALCSWSAARSGLLR